MRRKISFLLVLVLLLSCFTVPVFAGKAFWGSSAGGYPSITIKKPTGTSKYDPTNVAHGYYEEWAGSRCFAAIRMRAVPIDESKMGRQDYFTADYPFDGSRGKNAYMLEHQELIKADGYYDDNWKVFSNTKTGYTWTMVQAFEEGVITYPMHPLTTTYDNEIREFLTACGCPEKVGKVDITTSAGLDSVLHCDALDNDDENHTQRKKLAEYFGLTGKDAESFYIVVEQMPVMRNFMFGQRDIKDEGDTQLGLVYIDNVTVAGVNIGKQMEWYVGESLATYSVSDPQVNGRPTLAFGATSDTPEESMPRRGRSGAVSKYVTNGYGKLVWHQGKEAFFPDYTVVNALDPSVNGYSIYSFIESSTMFVGGNVAVEYDGDVNTSDPGKFKSTGSVIGVGDKTVNAYWDFAQSKFIDSEDEATLLKFAGKIDMTSEYALCFTAASDHNVSGDIKLDQRLQNAFEVAPGRGYTNSSLTWGNLPASGGAVNIGYTWKVTALESYRNAVPIINRFQDAFNIAASGQGQIATGSRAEDTTDTYKDYQVLEGSWLNAQHGMGLSSDGVLEQGQDNKYTLKDAQQLGMGYEFIIRGTPVTSRKITIKADAVQDNSGVVLGVSASDAETWREDYTTVKSTTCSVEEEDPYRLVVWFVVPGQDDSLTPSIVSAVESVREANDGAFRNAALSAVSASLIQGQGTGQTIVGLGSTLDEPPIGYTVYEVMWKGDPQPVVGQVVLPAYMLNRYFNNVIQTSSMLAGTPEKFTLAKDWTWVEWIDDTAPCGWVYHDDYKDDWVIEYYDAANSQEFGLDTGSMIDRYYPRGTGNWSSSVRSKLTHAWQESMDTRNISESAYVVDYAFNLVRGNAGFNDKRSISGVSYRTYVDGTGDSDNLLRISDKFGVTPSGIKKAAPARDSVAPLATYLESFNIQSRFQHTASPKGYHVQSKLSHYHTGYHGSHGKYACHCVCSVMYYPGLKDHTVEGFVGIASGRTDKITYKFSNTAYKYTTKDDLGVGKNDFLGGSTSKPLTAGRRNSTEGSITPSNFYRFTTVRYTDVDLKFHPENLMVFKIGGTDFAQINTQPYVMGYTMSEVKRTSKSSGMYFFRLNADITSLPGTVYSDAMQGGTGMMGFGSTVSIPAGADVTIAADPSGVDIDLYGYTLDLVQTDDDGKIGAVGSGRAYNTVVRSGLNAYNEWGNSTSHADLLRHFNEWCDNMLKVENFAADFQLYVGSGSTELKSENFSATIGRVERGTAGTVEDGIYQLVVEKGILQTSKGDYNALISQIATDYGCSNAEATAMFKESAMYTAIINGMETCKNDKNNSKDVHHGLTYTPDIKSEWTNQLGGDGNWYDETSRTFVVRRFTNLGNKLCDVIATDKIDYQLAPTGSSRPGENASSSLSYNAWWHLSIFFDQNAKDKVNDLLLGSSTYYDPQNGSINFNPANNAFSVMFNSIPVANADFKIPASSTQDFYN